MPDFRDELSLLIFVLLNIAVFASAWFFASRRTTTSRSQAILDAALLGYVVQYLSVGIPGLLHCLNLATMTATAAICVIAFIAAGWKRTTRAPTHNPGDDIHSSFSGRPEGALFGRPNRAPSGRPLNRENPATSTPGLVALALFVLTIIVMYTLTQAALPVLSNDALTYHFPAAVQWLQQHRISLFQTWFFNPANTYSPLAGSLFIAWMIAPFDSDVVARFVEAPALICVGIAMYRLCREMGARKNIAALVAAAAVLARPIFLPSMMGKDDLFVAFFFIAALVALSGDRSQERWGAARFGIALGLLLATKFTALLSVPILLLAIDSPRWRLRGWGIGIGVAALLAGPWYLRNWLMTGNPIFPMYSLFTTAPSKAFHTWDGAVHVILGGAYGLPTALAILLGIGWIFSLRGCRSDPIKRTCVLGIVPGLMLFYFASPFPEVRFVLPMFLLLFACFALVIDRYRIGGIIAGALLFAAALLTLFEIDFLRVIAGYSAAGVCVVLLGLPVIWWAGQRRWRWPGVICMLALIAATYAYINWKAYCQNYARTMFDEDSAYAVKYPESNQLWRFANQHIPADATVAYTNMYLIYPLQCDAMHRRLVYCPTRPGVKSIADLGWLGSHLSGKQLVDRAVQATVANPNRNVWLKNLRSDGCQYLICGPGGSKGSVPQEAFADSDAREFTEIFAGASGRIYRINDIQQQNRKDPSPTVSTAR